MSEVDRGPLWLIIAAVGALDQVRDLRRARASGSTSTSRPTSSRCEPGATCCRGSRSRRRTRRSTSSLAAVWERVFGDGEVALRSLSALFGTATIPVVYAAATAPREPAGRRWSPRRLTAASPMLIWYSQEARPYSLLVLLAAISFLCFVHVLDGPRPAVALGLGDRLEPRDRDPLPRRPLVRARGGLAALAARTRVEVHGDRRSRCPAPSWRAR